MLKMDNLTKKYGQQTILDHFNLSIKKGELVAIVGPSGSGKSTILNILGLIENFDSGQYFFMGHSNIKPNSSTAQKMIREKISYLFQNYALIEEDTVYQNLLLSLKYVKKSKSEKRKIINTALSEVGLAGFAERKVYELSGGQQQRVAIARALIKPSELLLTDEPTGSLDKSNRDEVFALLKKLNQQGKTIIVVTHDPEIAQQCERIIKL
ncbi:ABC transporter ATP-binding protein [Lactobacillus mulieris]|uniref:ABC transporter ATP-binding protein n=1 Tax=Lactobacillus mulieris TaxID=2508708 RepID=A0AAW5WZH1_9LACO|nr:ABC transporter ATP-binding protein [Lactobacillus mulieris]MCZ3622750.1 ABC transporter ATP-binding protein [Lactobacillus mulieris]MCZ3624447.1 ABC transporter ATP-binding protein [Lactobacillus mulieris]MCZ3636772.1 ABC transporter ATP-binding protein [Lactobacillus mulieris]MCZ3690619.1 ABC transporter ATP-binding protein [Lactobacillus mulieris]MCZ3696552.1 ABC transporter ATP-binding protein [Lactobacillus mulieris]